MANKNVSTILFPEASKYAETYQAYVRAHEGRRLTKMQAANELVVAGGKTTLPQDVQDAAALGLFVSDKPQGA